MRFFLVVSHDNLIKPKKETLIETTIAFSKLPLNEKLLTVLKDKGFEYTTPIQELTIPIILEGKDLFAQAETGSGKTGSFAIPALEQILRNNNGEIYIVLSPTRELAQQTHKVFSEFGEPLGVKSVCIIGGESFDRQKNQLTDGATVIIGTPGRICDLIKQKFIEAHKCRCVIFDEADRLFEMGFNKENEYVLQNVKPDRQLIMVSATNNQEVFRTAYKFNSNPEEIKLNEDSLMVDHINQQIAMISEEEKMPYLVNLLRKNEDAYAIVFCNTQYMTSLVALWLEQMGFKVKAISGRLPQDKRTRLLQDFRDKKINILVCTDVAARGLDIKDVNLVVNYDMPNEAANYVHRVGRTGRAGQKGLAIGLCGFDDCENLDSIYDYIGMKIPKVDLEDHDFATDVVKRPRIDSKTLKPFETKTRTERSEKPKTERTKTMPKDKIQKPTEKPIEEVKVFERFYTTSAYTLEEAQNKALSYFMINELPILKHEVLEAGKKKFFFFGPRLTTYQFQVEPIYRKILLPYLINIFNKMGLKIYVNVTYREPDVSVIFSGKDAGLLAKNRFELHNAIKDVAMLYLRNKISMQSNTNITFTTQTEERKPVDNFKSKERVRVYEDLSEDKLHKLADKAKNEVLSKKSPILMQKLNPAERRIIHQYIEQDSQFKSTSVGDGRLKQVEISLTK
jgi:ATP-dependent RNA helicase RhlE